MSYFPVEKLIDKADNSMFKLVIVAAKRAQELSEGVPKLVEADIETKTTTIALMEIAEGKVRLAKAKE